MPDSLVVVLLALAGSGAVALAGLIALRLLRGRSVTSHVVVLVLMTAASVVVGVFAVAREMFLSNHDFSVLLTVLGVVTAVSLAVALWSGRRLGRESVWAQQAWARERQIEESRRELVAWVSHDLRTPLAGMRAMAEALEDGVVQDPATVVEYHRRLRVEADRMSSLVDDLFELSRLNAGAVRLALGAVPLADVVSDAVATARPLAEAQQVRLEARDTTYGIVQASEPELGRVLSNLLLNAIRHTPADAVVCVDGGSDADGGWVSVSDSCGGIPERDLPKVFDVAFRGESARSRPGARLGSGGGLGLAIVRGLVDVHHGDVSVVNEGPGCRFTVRLPGAAAAPAPAQA